MCSKNGYQPNKEPLNRCNPLNCHNEKTKSFKYELGINVIINVSGESGKVKGRAQYLNNTDSYYIEYKTHLGVATNEWWDEDSISLAVSTPPKAE